MKYILLPLVFLFGFQLCYAQNFKLADTDGVKVSVKGNSTLHEWEAVASEVLDYPTEFTLDLSGNSLKTFGLKVGVESLDGGRGASMNKKINKALVAVEHPYIIFNSTSMMAVPSNDPSFPTDDPDFPTDDPNFNMVKSIGTLEIAGEKVDIEVIGTARLKDNELIVSGSKALKMSDFGIEPPTAMFGQIKTRDDIVVHFEFRYIKE